MSSVEVILKATDILTTLSVIDIQELLPYQRKLEDALLVLQRSVEAARSIQRQSRQPGSTPQISSSASAPRPPVPPATPPPQPPAEPDDTGPPNTDCECPNSIYSDRPTSHGNEIDLSKGKKNLQVGALNLLQILEDGKRSKKIWDYLSSSDCDPIDGSEIFDWTEEDPRVIDLRLSSRPKPSFDVKFRRGLSQRSLAAEYDEWEKATFNTLLYLREDSLRQRFVALDASKGVIKQ